MSAVAPPAAACAHPRSEPSVPAGPVPKRAAGHPLSLGRDARARLGGAVRALLDVAGLAGASDAVRLAVLVLASRTPSETGVVEIRTSELGRWLGLSASYTASGVVPVLRRSGVVSVETAEGEYGQDAGLKCRVLPLWAAQDVAGHPLNLSKKEYATLLRLLEAVMAPGWAHRDGSVTPAGLIGTRTGRGAATDRLALLLLVLEARETGRVRQCGGAVDTKRGRAAATVARLLGCSASAGERVLERLEERELVLRVRLRTGSGLANRSRLMVPAVAAAHGRTVADDIQEDRVEAPEPGFSDPDVAARPGEAPGLVTETQVNGAPVTDEAGVAEPDGAAALHTDHPHLVTPVIPVQLSDGFSGQGRGAEGRRPERACARKDRAADNEGTVAAGGSPVAEVGPLRGEQPHLPAATDQERNVRERERGTGHQSNARRRLPASVRSGHSGWQRAGVPPRPPRDLEVVLAPVAALWGRLERDGARRVVVRSARAALMTVAGVVGQGSAETVLADRLTRRLAEQEGGPAAVADPVGWLVGRGLPRRAACADPRCDDGLRMDTGGPCEFCAYLVADRRAVRHQEAAKVDAELPGVSGEERRSVYEQRLRERTAADAEHARSRRERAEAERAARQAACARARAKAEVLEEARQAQPCADCGRPGAAGLCSACGERRATERLVAETVDVVTAAWADLSDPADVAAVAAKADSDLRCEIRTAQERLRAGGKAVTAHTLAMAARLAVQNAADEYHSSALSLLARGQEAEAEARLVFESRMRSRHRYATRAAAEAAAGQEARRARNRTAQHLLTTRLNALRAGRTAATTPAEACVATSDVYTIGAARVRSAMREARAGATV
ncbi:hypothetical protein ABZ553_25315 [Streptomyces sparsogenes]|uniref:hypothetical protein n=1 Tax=Streptomyces sparsogenes TaxID=67365 RepID=UPI0033FB3515